MSQEQKNLRAKICEETAAVLLLGGHRAEDKVAAEERMWRRCWRDIVQYVREKEGGGETLLEDLLTQGEKLYRRLLLQGGTTLSASFRALFLCRLGDLSRYRGIAHLDAASDCYRQALKEDPTDGCPFNQLAIAAAAAAPSSSFRCLYFYARAACAPRPFAPAQHNFASYLTLLGGEQVLWAQATSHDGFVHGHGEDDVDSYVQALCVSGFLIKQHGSSDARLNAILNIFNSALARKECPAVLLGLELIRHDLKIAPASVDYQALCSMLNSLREGDGTACAIGTPLPELDAARGCGLDFVEQVCTSTDDCVLSNIRVRRLICVAQQLAEGKLQWPLKFEPSTGVFEVRETKDGGFHSDAGSAKSESSGIRAAQPGLSSME